MRIAILDDYQGVALRMADWSAVASQADIEIFREHLGAGDQIVRRLADFDVLCVMRERTPLPREVLEQLPRLRLIVSTGFRNASIDAAAVEALGITVINTGYVPEPTLEHAWALILGALRHVADDAGALRTGGWQTRIGVDLSGKTLGLLGLGNLGSRMARIGQAFGMQTIAWSQNLTQERAHEFGALRVDKDELFAKSDVLSVHLILSARTRGLVDGRLLGLMRPSAWLINTSRGPIVDEQALLEALRQDRLAGAALDVFDAEPLPPDHPFRSEPKILATPHVGYVSERQYQTFYGDTVRALVSWLAAQGDDSLAADRFWAESG